MPFGNPIVGGEELIRNAIRSDNYVQGTTGWRIGRDGSAEFQNFAARQSITAVSGGFSSSLIYRGTELQTLLDQLPKGVVAWRTRTAGQELWGTGTQGPVAMVTFVAKPNRLYRLGYSGIQLVSSVAGTTLYAWWKYTVNGTNPTTASADLPIGAIAAVDNAKATDSGTPYGAGFYQNLTGSDQTVKVGLFAIVGGGGATTVSTNESIGCIVWCEDLGLPVANGIGCDFFVPGAGATSTPTYFNNIWYATSVQSYQQNGNQSIATGASTYGYQGDGSAVGNPGGDHSSEFFFNSAAMRAELAGATILNTHIYLINVHCYSNSGVTAGVGYHNCDPTPASVCGARVENQWFVNYAKGGDGEFAVGSGLGSLLQSGGARGITLGYEGPGSLGAYSYFTNPYIRIEYTK